MTKKIQEFFTIMDGRVKMVDNGYKTTVDAVWLADAVQPPKGTEKLLDVGIGAGGASLCLLERFQNLNVTGIDISDEMLSSAWVNALANERGIALEIADIFKWKTGAQFDIVITNPPYFSGTPRKDKAHHNVDIYEWTRACIKRLAPRGMFYTIVAPDVLDQVVAAMYDAKLGAITLHPIATKTDNIERIVISGRLGVKTKANMFFPIDAAD